MAPALTLFARLRIWSLLLLLAAIGMQAAEPIRAPLERVSGSAFSAATLDVALSSVRRASNVPTAAAQPLAPPPAAAPSPQEAGRPARLAIEAFPHSRPEARGPPPRSHPARLPDSTAPPAT